MGRHVRIRTWGIGAGGAAPAFSDTLISPDQPLAIGDLWYTTFNLINASGTAGVTISQGLNRTATGLQFTNASGAGYLPTAIAIPSRLSNADITPRSQFVQCVYVSSVGVADLDLMCFCTQNSFSFYGMNFISTALQLSVLRRASGGNTQLIAAGAGTAFVANDTIRMETNNSVAGQTTITIKVNGTTVGSAVDNSGSRYSGGIPGIYFNGANPAANIVIKNFSCGVL